MGRGSPGDPVRLRRHVPARAPQRPAPHQDVVRRDGSSFHGLQGQGGLGRCFSEMGHLNTAQDIASVIGNFLEKWERGESIWKTFREIEGTRQVIKEGIWSL